MKPQLPEIHTICQPLVSPAALSVCGHLSVRQQTEGRECLMQCVGCGDEQPCATTFPLTCWRVETMEKIQTEKKSTDAELVRKQEIGFHIIIKKNVPDNNIICSGLGKRLKKNLKSP